MIQKTMTIIRHDQPTLPILDFMSAQDFMATALSDGVIIWDYKGLAMLVPVVRIKNMARMVENQQKAGVTLNKKPKLEFHAIDAVKIPALIREALLYTA